ncbi:MAG: HAD family hydrolase [Candidatus Heimdallarchaeaceae archaeon]
MGADPEGSQDIVREEFANEFSSGENFQLVPECQETLKWINETGIKTGLLSHASPNLCKLVLERFGILDYFDLFVLTEEVGYHKFQIEIYEIALERMKTDDPATIIHVGDDLNLGVRMAQKVGMIPIYFNPLELHETDDIITIRDLMKFYNISNRIIFCINLLPKKL